MSVAYRDLNTLNTRAFSAASEQMSRAVSTLAREYRQYRSGVTSHVKAGKHWRHGGQPDAAAVTEANGLAIDTMRLRAAAGGLAYLYGFTGFTLAKQRLAALKRELEAEDFEVDEDGNVSSTFVPVGDDGGPGSTSAKVLGFQRDIGKILQFATTVDDKLTGRLNRSHEPPVVSRRNYAGLLGRARQDHADAVADARSVLGALHDLPDDANHELPPLDPNDLPDLPGVHIEVPPGAAATNLSYGLFAAGLVASAYGLYGAGVGASAGPEGTLPGLAVAAVGAGVAAIGAAGIRLGGGTVPDVTVTDGAGRTQTYSLDDIVSRAASRAERQADPGYGGAPTQPSGTPAGGRPFDPGVAEKVKPWGEPDAKTRGILDSGGSQHDLTSGQTSITRDLPRPRPGMNGRTVDHVEAQAAAYLRTHHLEEGTLYINRLPCGGRSGCDAMLERMVPQGSRLTIYGPDGYARVVTGRG